MRQNNRRKNYQKGTQPDGLTVEVRNGDFNGAMRRFKKKVQEAGIIQEVRERQFYEKPSAKRKRKKDAAVKRTKKAEDLAIAKGEWMPYTDHSSKSMKGKRERRKVFMQKERIRRLSSRRVK